MANRNAKLIERTLKDFSLGVFSGGGDSEVVTELPKVGKEHTIYELHQKVEPAYNWVAEINDIIYNANFSPVQSGAYLLVVETYDDMLAKVNEDTLLQGGASAIVYLRAEDRMFAYIVDDESGTIARMEFQKKSAYSFESENAHLYVLKSIREDLGTPEHPLEDAIYYGTLYNGTEFLLDYHSGKDKAFILHQVTFEEIYNFNATGHNIHQVSTLPTAEEAVENYNSELYINGGNIYVEIDGVIKYCYSSGQRYYWDNEIQNFVAGTEGSAEEPVIYIGELEWGDLDYTIYSYIPYQDIFDGNLYEWAFKPEQGGEKVSYWIYANNVWTNTENIGKQEISPFIKEGTKIIVDLRREILQIGDYPGNQTKYQFLYYQNEKDAYTHGAVSVWTGLYNDRISVKLFPNEAQNQLIATIAAQEESYWKLEQPIVVYEGDVSNLTDTSSIQNQLPEQIIFTLNKNDFVSGNGAEYLDGSYIFGYMDDIDALDIIDVEI